MYTVYRKEMACVSVILYDPINILYFLFEIFVRSEKMMCTDICVQNTHTHTFFYFVVNSDFLLL